jgi:hypothetical protein
MRITQLEQLGNYRLLVTFTDGTRREADFGAFLQSSTRPLVRQFADPVQFATVHLDEFGVLVWGDDEMDINPVSIHAGAFEPVRDQAIA